MFVRTEWGRGGFQDRVSAAFRRCHSTCNVSCWKQPILKVLCVARPDAYDEWGGRATFFWSTFFTLDNSALEHFTGPSRPAWMNAGPPQQAEIKGSNQEKCVWFWKLHKAPGKCILLPGVPSEAFEAWCFRGSLWKSVINDLVLFFQTCLLFSSVKMSSFRGLGLSLGFFSPALEPCWMLWKRRYSIALGKLHCTVNYWKGA